MKPQELTPKPKAGITLQTRRRSGAVKSRRDGLFIAQDAANAFFFLFFSGAGKCGWHIRMARPAPLKNKKKCSQRHSVYKQVIPTGFQMVDQHWLLKLGISS